MRYPFVSIIVPMFNAEETIEQCVTSLISLDYPSNNYEIIIVNHNSTDKSTSILKKYPVRVVNKVGGTIASVRNYGTTFAHGEIYAFVDSDCLVYVDWLKRAVEQLLTDKRIGATGCGYVAPKNSSWVENAWLYESEHPSFETDFIPSGNFFIMATVFKQVEGFNEDLTTCEDAAICQRVVAYKYKVVNNSSIKSIHLRNPKTFNQFFLKELWYGRNMADTDSKFYLDKVLLATIIYIIAHAFVPIGSIIYIICDSFLVLLSAFFLIVLICACSTLYRIKRSKKYKYFIHTFFLYYIYFASRSISLFKTNADA